MKKNIILGAFLLLVTASFAQIDRTKQPEPGPAPTINLQDPNTFSLKNGLKVLVVENHKLPRVSIQLTMDNPLIVEGNKAGTTDLVAALLGKGSKNISKDDFNEEVDFLGSSINFGSQSAFGSGLSKYFNRILELMADAGINPNFLQEEFDKERDIIIEGLKSNEKSVSAIAGRVQNVLAYGANHPYGEYTTEKTINNVTLADVKKFHSDYFRPNNAYLIIIGDVNYKDVKKAVKKNFKRWKSGKLPITPYGTPQNPSESEIDFISMDNAVQSEIAVQNTVSLKMSDADYFPTLIANKILGGGGEARLFNNLREDKGYTYGAYSSIGSNKKTVSRFRATASVRNTVTDSAVVEFMKEIEKIGTQFVSNEELANAKAKYVGDFVLALERPQTIANYAYNIETRGLSKDYYKNYLANINNVSKEDVKNAARKFFQGNNAQIVITGKGSEVVDNLENIVFNGKKLTVNYYDKTGKKIDKPEFKKEIPADINVTKVLQNYIDAIGGNTHVANVNSLLINAEASIQGQTLNLEMKKTTKNQFVQDIMMAGNSMSKQVLDGNKGYILARGQRKDFTDEELKSVQAESSPFPEINWLNGGVTLEKIEKINGEDAYIIKVSDDKEIAYSVKTGFKLQETTTREAGGQTIKQILSYSDYKALNGIMFPYIYSQSFGPQKIDFKVTEIKINEGVSDQDFD